MTTYTAHNAQAEYNDDGHLLTAKTDKSARAEAKKLATEKGWSDYEISFFRSTDGCTGSIDV